MFKELLETVRMRKPLIHNITNYVTVNDCANVLLACGGSPIMADDAEEVEEITAICDGLNINIGTLSRQRIPSMFLAGKKANALGHPVVLDPVGAGACTLRTETALKLLDEVKFSAIRGNISEIKALAFGKGKTNGVDADLADTVTADNLEQAVEFAKRFAERTGHCDRWAAGLLHLQWASRNGENHGGGVSAVRADCGIHHRQPGNCAGSNGSGGVQYGLVR